MSAERERDATASHENWAKMDLQVENVVRKGLMNLLTTVVKLIFNFRVQCTEIYVM